jgi:hypothetical protein
MKEGRKVMGRGGGGCKESPHNFKETREYWKLKYGALDYTRCKTRFRKDFGSA